MKKRELFGRAESAWSGITLVVLWGSMILGGATGVLFYLVLFGADWAFQALMVAGLLFLALGALALVLMTLTEALERANKTVHDKDERRVRLEKLEQQRETARQFDEKKEQEAAQARRQEEQAYMVEVERFHTDRLIIERHVVGDEELGIRSPYEVEMTRAEIALLKTISPRFDPSCLLVDTYLNRDDGRTTQIDIIAICQQGIIVIESKGLGGTIRGDVDDAQWIQEPSGWRTNNPIWQNDLHVEVIRRVLEPTETQLWRMLHTGSASQTSPEEVLEESLEESLRDEKHYFRLEEGSDLPSLMVFGGGARFPNVSSDGVIPHAATALNDDPKFLELKFLPDFIYSLVVFNAGAKFPDLKLYSSTCQVVAAHRVNDALDRILSTSTTLSDADVMKVAHKIRKHRVIPDKDVRETHIRDIQEATGRYGVLE